MVLEPHLRSSFGETTKNQRAGPSATQGSSILTNLHSSIFAKHGGAKALQPPRLAPCLLDRVA